MADWKTAPEILLDRIDAIRCEYRKLHRDMLDQLEWHAGQGDSEEAGRFSTEAERYGMALLATNRIYDLVASFKGQAGDGWLPIESAPKDGTKFDAWVPDAFGGHRMTGLSTGPRGDLRQHGSLTAADLPRWPTHWMPLPAPPAKEGR